MSRGSSDILRGGGMANVLQPSGGAEALPKGGYVLAGLLIVGIVTWRYMVPTLLDNEGVYLIPARRLIEPSFLANDWTAVSGAGNTAILFSALLSPLWMIFNDPLTVALVARGMVFLLLVVTLLRFTFALHISATVAAVGISLWIVSGQSLAASEFVFGSVEQKSLSYIFILMALTAFVRDDLRWAGVWAGMAIGAHALVGGWASIAMALALLSGYFDERRSKSCREFVLITAMIGAPFIIHGIISTEMISSSTADIRINGLAIDEYVVTVRVPHHTDPAYFLNLNRIALLILMPMGAVWGAFRVLTPISAKLVSGFLLGLLIFFMMGLIARYFQMFWFLKFYPFRVADVAVPLFFWVFGTAGVWSVASKHIENRKLILMNIWRLETPVVLLILALMVGLLIERGGGFFTTNAGPFHVVWQERLSGHKDDRERMTEWVRQFTPRRSLFIVNPCYADFPIETERAMTINFKIAAHGPGITEWNRRMLELNGGEPIRSKSFLICQEIAKRYGILPKKALEILAKKYGAEYYLVNRRRESMEDLLLHQEGELFLYRLHV